MCYLQLGKGGMVAGSGLSHINGLAGFGPGVLNPAGKAHPSTAVSSEMDREYIVTLANKKKYIVNLANKKSTL